MIKSSKARKQRFYRFNAPLHARQHFLHAHLSKELRARLKLSKRALQAAKGDSVKIISGGNAGKEGKITKVNIRKGFVYVDSIKRKNAKGKESDVPIHVSNVYITDLNLSDKIRASKVKEFQNQK